MRRWAAVGGLVVLALALGVGATADIDIEITVDGSFDTPPETVTVDGDEFTVSAVGRTLPGDTFEVDVRAPGNKRYELNLYTLDEEVQSSRQEFGSDSDSFETDFLAPGSYLIGVVDEDGFQAVHPVVVAGYAVDVSAPSTVDENASFDVTVRLDELDDTKPVGRVELAVWNDDTRERFEARQVDNRTYEVTVDGLAHATYDLYAVAVAEEQIDGEDDVVGFSDPRNLTVREVIATPTPTDDGTPTDGDTPTDDSSSDSSTPTETPGAGDTTGTPTGTPTDTPGGVITPATETETVAADDGPGFGIGAATLAVLAILAVCLARVRAP